MTTTQKHVFQAETKELLDLMIHSLYSHREVFLRELISNASDALDKVRFEALTQPDLLGDDTHLRVRLERDSEARTLVVDDNGLGMTEEEIVANLGTIARSGTRGFSEELRRQREDAGEAAAADAPELIGRFGVGFYSAFMVAGEVVVESRRAGESGGVRWSSKGDGEFEVEEIEKASRGTRITLHLRSEEETDGEYQDFTAEWKLREVVKRYSDFVEYPIEMDIERTKKPEGDEDAEPQTVVTTEVLNSTKPLWTRPRNEIEESEYHEFYRHLTHEPGEPLDTIHLKAEGTTEYTALIYLPKQRPFDLFDPDRAKSRLALYVKRVFVMKDCEELLPPWLRFVRGIVDSTDLPLNVSRETLQHDRQVRQIKKRLVRKIIDVLGALREKDAEAFGAFWKEFGAVLKEGLYLDPEHTDDLLKICLFASSTQDDSTTLAEYVERMPVAQTEIYVLTGSDVDALKASPHLEALRQRGFEALLLVDPVDEFVLQRITEFEGKAIRALDRDGVALDTDEDRSQREQRQTESKELLEAAAGVLEDWVTEVRLSSRLTDSPAVLVSEGGAPSPQLEAMLRASGQELPPTKRVLELNPDHAVFAKLEELYGAKGGSDRFDATLELLHGQALLSEGSPLPDPARYAKRVAEFLS